MTDRRVPDIDELLNAHLDGELDADDRLLVEGMLAASPTMRRDLDELASVRRMVRELPEVAPPGQGRPLQAAPTRVDHSLVDPRVVEPATRSHHATSARARRPVVALLAAAAVVTLAMITVGAVIGRPPVTPQVDTFALRHASIGDDVVPDADGPTEATVELAGFEAADAAAMADPAVLDDIGDGMDRMSVYRRGDVVETRYGDGAHVVSVFHEPGEVDWNSLPDDGAMVEMADGPGWQMTMSDAVVVIVERGDLVVTVVSDADMGPDMAMATSAMVPAVERDESLWQRLEDAPRNLVDRL